MTVVASRWLRGRARVDRLLALVALVPVVPLLAVLAVLVVVVDRQRPFVGLDRVGRDGRRFTLWKVRTMREDGGRRRAFTVRDDDRITGLGRRLRRWRLDEVPQLWNIVRGDMALLGPRPEDPEYVDLDDPAWRAALATPPGIAGPTQVVIHGWESHLDGDDDYRSHVLPRKLEVDAWYVSQASPRIDLDVVSSLLRSLAVPDARTAVHRRLAAALPATLAAIDRRGEPGDPPFR